MSSRPRDRLTTLPQATQFTTPWPLKTRLLIVLWSAVQLLLFRPTPKPLCFWRLFLLRLFGCRISGRPYVAPSARIKMPWNVTLEDRACVGPESELYSLGPITLKARCTITQQAYLCAGTHDFSLSHAPMVTGPIVVGEDAWVFTRAFVLPGVVIGEGAVIGACSVVSADMPPWTVCAGNPCKPLKPRQLAAAPVQAAAS